MSSYAAVLKKMRALVKALPDTREDEKWGKPHFVVKEKIFCGCSPDEDGTPTIGFKLEQAHAAKLVKTKGFWPSKYVGKHGWVTMDASGAVDWDVVRDYLLESFRLIAPKGSIAKLGE